MAPQNELPLQEVPVPRAPWLSPTMHTALYMMYVCRFATCVFANVIAVLGLSAQMRPSYLINGSLTLRDLVRTS